MASTALVPPPIPSTQGMLRPPSPSASSRQSRSDSRRSPVLKHAFLALPAEIGVDTPLAPVIATSAGPPQTIKHAGVPITHPITQQPLSSGQAPSDFDLRARRRSSLGLGLLDAFGADFPTSGIWVDRALSDHDFAQLLPGTLQESTTSAQQTSSSLTGLLPTDFFSLRGAFAGYTEHQIETMYSESSTSNFRAELSEPQHETLEIKESGEQPPLQAAQSTNSDNTGDALPNQSNTTVPLFPSITEQL
ncbi:hypothetical protein HK405_008893, partial [Cladochytrium tenue]